MFDYLCGKDRSVDFPDGGGNQPASYLKKVFAFILR